MQSCTATSVARRVGSLLSLSDNYVSHIQLSIDSLVGLLRIIGGKCVSGDYSGCLCTKEKCPGGIYTLNCDDCGNDGDEYGICDGVSNSLSRTLI